MTPTISVNIKKTDLIEIEENEIFIVYSGVKHRFTTIDKETFNRQTECFLTKEQFGQLKADIIMGFKDTLM